MRTVAFKTFGCRLNQAETVAFERAFAEAGMRRVRFGEPADVVVVHSCVVTQAAEDDCLRQLRALRRRLPAARWCFRDVRLKRCRRLGCWRPARIWWSAARGVRSLCSGFWNNGRHSWEV